MLEKDWNSMRRFKMKSETAKTHSKCPENEEKYRKKETVISIEVGNHRALLKGMRDWDPAPYSPRQLVYS
jgi:hypothetical protein